MNICDSILNAFNFGAHTHSTSVWVFIYIVTLPAGLHSILYIHAYNIQYGMHNYNYCNSIHWLHTFTQFSGLQSFLKSIEKVQLYCGKTVTYYVAVLVYTVNIIKDTL